LIELQHGRPSGFTFAISRAYTITVTGGGPFSATLRLHYQDSELSNGETNIQLWRFNGSIWVQQGSTNANTTDNWVEQVGVSAFSPWSVANQTPTAITLNDFRASERSISTVWSYIAIVIMLFTGLIVLWRMRRRSM
jgi:hypothetical protein